MEAAAEGCNRRLRRVYAMRKRYAHGGSSLGSAVSILQQRVWRKSQERASARPGASNSLPLVDIIALVLPDSCSALFRCQIQVLKADFFWREKSHPHRACRLTIEKVWIGAAAAACRATQTIFKRYWGILDDPWGACLRDHPQRSSTGTLCAHISLHDIAARLQAIAGQLI